MLKPQFPPDSPFSNSNIEFDDFSKQEKKFGRSKHSYNIEAPPPYSPYSTTGNTENYQRKPYETGGGYGGGGGPYVAGGGINYGGVNDDPYDGHGGGENGGRSVM